MQIDSTLSAPLLDYDPFSADTVADPYPIYGQLRAKAPIYHNRALGFYALTRYGDLVQYGRDWRTFSYAEGADIDDTGEAFGPGNFMDLDPPQHTAMRDVVRRAFTPKALRTRLGEVIERESAALLDGLLEEGGGDFGWDVAWQLPMRVTAELLGLPRADLPLLGSWEVDFSRRILGERLVPPFALEASRRFQDYFAELISDKARRPQDDLLSMIAEARVDGRPLGDAAASMAFLFWGASVETTGCLLTNGVVLLDAHPDQREWLVQHPGAIPDAVEEMLRFDAPLQVTRRTTTRPVEVHGVRVPSGASVLMVFGAANRDERRFEAADQFDVTRKPRRHLAFGDGIHHCLGAPLARLEAAGLFGALLSRAPRFAVRREALVRLEHYIDRGFVHVPMIAEGG
jgi:cytochrome P450 family 130